MSKIIKIKTCELVTDGLQTRHELDSEAVIDYAENYKNDVAMPPISVVEDPETGEYYLVDGFHRMAASVQTGLTELEAEIVAEGDHTAALKIALKANQMNGQRRTNADKRAALTIAWANREQLFGNEQPTERQLAEITGVSVFLVHTFLKDNPLLENSKKKEERNKSASERAVKKLLKEGKDRFGQTIPEKILPAFHTAALRKLYRMAKDVIAFFEKARESGDLSFAKVAQQGLIDFRNGARHLKFGEAYCICPNCVGRGCYWCDELGWMNKEQYDRLPPESKPKAK